MALCVVNLDSTFVLSILLHPLNINHQLPTTHIKAVYPWMTMTIISESKVSFDMRNSLFRYGEALRH